MLDKVNSCYGTNLLLHVVSEENTISPLYVIPVGIIKY